MFKPSRVHVASLLLVFGALSFECDPSAALSPPPVNLSGSVQAVGT